MSGTWTSGPNFRVDSENYLTGIDQGTYNTAIKYNVQFVTTGATGLQVTYVAGTPQAFTWTSFPIADLQAYFFMVDQGTATDPIILKVTCSTNSVSVNMLANDPLVWSLNQPQPTTGSYTLPNYGMFSGSESAGTYTSFGANAVSATLDIPAGLALPSPGLVNFTGRILTS